MLCNINKLFWKKLIIIFTVISTIFASNTSAWLVLTNCGKKQIISKNDIVSNPKNIKSKSESQNEKINETVSWFNFEYLNWLDINNNKKDISDFSFDVQTDDFEIWKDLLFTVNCILLH